MKLSPAQFKAVRLELRKAEPGWLATFNVEREDIQTLLAFIDALAQWDNGAGEQGGLSAEHVAELQARLKARGEDSPKLNKLFAALVERAGRTRK